MKKNIHAINKRKAFTLLELLIALSTLSIIVPAMAFLLIAGGRAADNQNDFYANMVMQERVSQEIENLTQNSANITITDASIEGVLRVGQLPRYRIFFADDGDGWDLFVSRSEIDGTGTQTTQLLTNILPISSPPVFFEAGSYSYKIPIQGRKGQAGEIIVRRFLDLQP